MGTALFPFSDDNPLGLPRETDPVKIAQLEALNSILRSEADGVAILRALVKYARQRGKSTLLLTLDAGDDILRQFDAISENEEPRITFVP